MHSGVVVLFVLGKHGAHGGELATEGLFCGAVAVGGVAGGRGRGVGEMPTA